jgi:hypothetical protein
MISGYANKPGVVLGESGLRSERCMVVAGDNPLHLIETDVIPMQSVVGQDLPSTKRQWK